MKGYPKQFVPVLLAALLFLALSGLLLAPETLFLKGEIDVPWRLSGTPRVILGALHATGAFIIMMLTGALWSVHMRAGWRKKKQRVSGALLAGCMALLCITAIGIYYLADEGLGPLSALAHLGLGIALLPPFIWHWLKGRNRVQRMPAPQAVAAPQDDNVVQWPARRK